MNEPEVHWTVVMQVVSLLALLGSGVYVLLILAMVAHDRQILRNIIRQSMKDEEQQALLLENQQKEKEEEEERQNREREREVRRNTEEKGVFE